MAVLYILKGYDAVGYVLYRHYLPRAAYTFLLVPLFYYFNRGFSYILREERSQS